MSKKRTDNKSRKRRRITKAQFVKADFSGFDYGIKPPILSCFNPEFIELWSKAECVGVAYTIAPLFGIRIDVPIISIVFKHYDIGVKLFHLFKDWMAPPCNSSAIDLSFVEYEKAKQYKMVFGVDYEQLIIRTFGRDAGQDYNILATTGSVIKILPLSDNYRNFKYYAQGKDIYVCPIRNFLPKDAKDLSSHITVINSNLISTECGFFANNINYLVGDASNSIETLLSAIYNDKKIVPEGNCIPDPPTPEEVSIRRHKQMKRFFPVLLARLKFNPSFQSAQRELRNYAEWQIIQAACNIYAINNWPAIGNDNNINMMMIYERLINSTQSATEDAMLTYKFTTPEVEKQLLHDMKYLHDTVCPDSHNDILTDLREKGYI